MLRLALKMLFGDSAKYLMLISGITFATLLMTQGAALFCGGGWLCGLESAVLWVDLQATVNEVPTSRTIWNRAMTLRRRGWMVNSIEAAGTQTATL